jgi:nicotinate phosphoribosyltransferase
VSRDVPSVDIVYKLVEYAGHGRTKLSFAKTVLPGPKQVFRVDQDGFAQYDVIGRRDDLSHGRALLEPVMAGGVRLPGGRVTLEQARLRANTELERLPPRLRAIQLADPPYRVEISDSLKEAHLTARGCQKGLIPS